MDVARFKKMPLMGILRGVPADMMAPLVETAITHGLETLEIAMNSDDACEGIRQAVRTAGGRLMVGAGTVLSADDLSAARDAGATFIVMPVVVPEVLSRCVEEGIPIFPGALTPHEIYDAWCAGATMVKVFPAQVFGPEYFREVKAPLAEVELLACGGVTPETMRAYFSHGANAVAFGASVFKAEWLAARDFERIGGRIREYVQGFKDQACTGKPQ